MMSRLDIGEPWQNIDTHSKIEQLGFDLPRKILVTLNRLRTGQDRCNHLMHKWELHTTSPSCGCGYEAQTVTHTVNECPIRAFKDTLNDIHTAIGDSVEWIYKTWKIIIYKLYIATSYYRNYEQILLVPNIIIKVYLNFLMFILFILYLLR